MGVKKRRRRLHLALIFVFTIVLALLAWPREDIALKQLGIDEPLKVRRGLDLQGGAYLVYEADMSALPPDSSQSDVLNNTRAVIERRVNPGGAGEAIVQTGANNRIIVQLPGINDPEEAKQTIGRTAQLSFYEVTAGEQAEILPTGVSGQDVSKATVDFSQQTSQPVVALDFKGGESTSKFAEVTQRLSANGNQLVTMLDDQVVFGPANVQDPITDGKAQLSGQFTVREAKEIATLLNAGALPVPVKLVAQQSIGPTLGSLSIKQSLVAAFIGLASVSVFLIVYYRLAGLASVGSLLFYTLSMLVVIKISALTPYVLVLTLAGIAGFILSVAVAVDANVLILERMKEELAKGASPAEAAEAGFTHAWTSIRDANASTVISCLILYNFGTAVIKGFALTLLIGVALGLVTAISVSRVLLRWLARSRWSSRTNWVGFAGLGE